MIKYFGITQNDNGNYDIEIQSINKSQNFVYSNADFDSVMELAYIY